LFERAYHRRIAQVLEALDADALRASHCWFGGGTAIALSRGEYRESRDIDFVVSDLDGFRRLRQKVTGKTGLRALARRGALLHPLREVRADQYGLRTLLDVQGAEIKFEIILEARVSLETPPDDERSCGVSRLSRLDLATTKLLANSDRWADDAVHSRDLIDLAMLGLTPKERSAAIDKARGAYGAAIERDLKSAVEALRRRPGRLAECMHALGMSPAPAGLPSIAPAVLWSRIRALRPKARRKNR
jgi:Nucleotidyl transferase AbiEii toxin, Type IV TA system